MSLLRWWWHWAGPYSPIGPVSGVLVFIPSVVAVCVFLLPPLLWLFHPVLWAIAGWWHWWLAAG